MFKPQVDREELEGKKKNPSFLAKTENPQYGRPYGMALSCLNNGVTSGWNGKRTASYVPLHSSGWLLIFLQWERLAVSLSRLCLEPKGIFKFESQSNGRSRERSRCHCVTEQRDDPRRDSCIKGSYGRTPREGCPMLSWLIVWYLTVNLWMALVNQFYKPTDWTAEQIPFIRVKMRLNKHAEGWGVHSVIAPESTSQLRHHQCCAAINTLRL